MSDKNCNLVAHSMAYTTPVLWPVGAGFVDNRGRISEKRILCNSFATGDSLTSGKLDAVCPRPYEEDRNIVEKVWESLHISNLMEKAGKFNQNKKENLLFYGRIHPDKGTFNEYQKLLRL